MSYHEMACDAGCGPGSDWHEQMEQMAEQMHRQMIEREWEKKAEEKEIEEMEYNLRVDNDQLRADLAAARKWAKAWKAQATGERIQKEQCIDALADVTHERNKLLDQQVVSRVNINSAHKEIERLNGRRCDGCKWFREYSPRGFCEHVDSKQKHPTDDYTIRHYEPAFLPGHHCKNWEKC